MSETTCNHCGQTFDDQQSFCPRCHAPTPAQQEKEIAAHGKRKFILLFIALIIFCVIMIVWLPRDIPTSIRSSTDAESPSSHSTGD